MKWTSITERLPSKQGEYLVTTSADDEYKYVEIQYFNKCKFYNADDEWGDMYDEGVTAWMPLPEPYGAEQSEPKRGKWKPKNHHTDYCSECGFEETQWRTSDYNFCPNCGADMRGERDE